MKTTRRQFLKTVGTGALAAGVAPRLLGGAPAVATKRRYDVCVIGAGVFGSWIALALRQEGRSVALVDGYGPGNALSSSGGQTRVIRMGYGDQEIYSRWSLRSLDLWLELVGHLGRPDLFQKSGVLWMAREEDPLSLATLATLSKMGVAHERLDRAELEARWPQIDFGPVTWAIHEPESGFLVAFHTVEMVAERARQLGADLLIRRIRPPATDGPGLDAVVSEGGEPIHAGTYVFACGPWLPKLFPELLGDIFFVTRQEVFYLATPPGDDRFSVGALPVWADFGEEIYGIPDFKGRGFKVAPDRHGPLVDPDTLERIVSPGATRQVLDYTGRRFPALARAPVVGSEVCQYSNTSSGDFLIDRHPELSNVWLVGGGSGHGFKHGPALGEYVTARLLADDEVDPRFSLATKEPVQRRAVY